MRSRIESEILKCLNDRVPNFVSEDMLKNDLTKYDTSSFDEAIKKLLREKVIIAETDIRGGVLEPLNYYRIKDFDKTFIKESIKIGDTAVPRVLSHSQASFLPEHLNEMIIKLADYTDNVQRLTAENVKKFQKDYWAKTISIFTIFIGLLAIVFRAIPEPVIDSSATFKDLFRQNVAQLLPLALLFLIFSFASWVIVKL